MDEQRVWRIDVEFGDCDPAGIVYYPNFYRWMDAASRHWFVVRGIDAWRGTDARWGIVGTPVVDVQTRFFKPALYGDRLTVHTEVTEWRGKSFVQQHRVLRADDLLLEGTEVRVFAARRDGGGIRAVEPPDAIKALA